MKWPWTKTPPTPKEEPLEMHGTQVDLSHVVIPWFEPYYSHQFGIPRVDVTQVLRQGLHRLTDTKFNDRQSAVDWVLEHEDRINYIIADNKVMSDELVSSKIRQRCADDDESE